MTLTAVWRDVMTSNAKWVTALRTSSSLDSSSLGAPVFDTGGKVIGLMGPVPWLCFNDSTGDHSSSVANSACPVSQLSGPVQQIGKVHGGRKTWLAVDGVSVDWPGRRQGARPAGLVRLSRPDRGPGRTRRARRAPRRESRQGGHPASRRPYAVSHRRRHHRRHRRQASALGGGLLQDPRRPRAGRRSSG